MQFNDTTDKDGLIQDIETKLFGDNAYGYISGNTTRLKTFTRYINRALDYEASLIMENDWKWQYDDTNYTDYPIATTDLVDGQQDYVLSTDHMTVLKVFVKDSSGDYQLLQPLDITDYDEPLNQEGEPDGMPEYYDKLGKSLFLDPTPKQSDVTLSEGLKVYFQRPPKYFSSTDTTKEPGIPKIFHEVVSLRAAFAYATDQQMTAKNDLSTRLTQQEQALQRHFTQRSGDDRPRLDTLHGAYASKGGFR